MKTLREEVPGLIAKIAAKGEWVYLGGPAAGFKKFGLLA